MVTKLNILKTTELVLNQLNLKVYFERVGIMVGELYIITKIRLHCSKAYGSSYKIMKHKLWLFILKCRNWTFISRYKTKTKKAKSPSIWPSWSKTYRSPVPFTQPHSLAYSLDEIPKLPLLFDCWVWSYEWPYWGKGGKLPMEVYPGSLRRDFDPGIRMWYAFLSLSSYPHIRLGRWPCFISCDFQPMSWLASSTRAQVEIGV